ncbi:pentapeptide repeat-containing protein [Streptomyces olivaceoviridis]
MVTDPERKEHAARLRGLLYLACPDAPAAAITEVAEAMAQRAEEPAQAPVAEAAHLTDGRESAPDPLNLSGADLSGANLTGADLSNANLSGAWLMAAVDLGLPPRAIWDRETRWPFELASVVVEQSDEVSPGVYQVRGGTAPDRSGAIRV